MKKQPYIRQHADQDMLIPITDVLAGPVTRFTQTQVCHWMAQAKKDVQTWNGGAPICMEADLIEDEYTLMTEDGRVIYAIAYVISEAGQEKVFQIDCYSTLTRFTKQAVT